MRITKATLLGVLLGTLLLILAACGGEVAEESAPPAEKSAAQGAGVQTTPAAQEAAPLPDESLYTEVLSAGLDFSYDAKPEDGTVEVLQNMEGYGAIQWTDEDHKIVVTRRNVAGDPEVWTYVDETAPGEGVTELKPSGEMLQRWDALASDMLKATGADAKLTRAYAWTAANGIGTTAYSTDGVSDDPNIHLSFGEGGPLKRWDYTVR